MLPAAIRRYAALCVFLIALPALWLRLGHWFYFSIDEGIYLEGATRVARGQVPYRDFFVLTGPGTFWLYGAVFRFFGETFANARFVLCLELAILCAVICWLGARLTRTSFAAAAALLFLTLLLTTPYPLYITHRWDSNMLALLALAIASADGWSSRRFVFAGICAGAAAWTTPPLLLIGLALGLWIWMASKSDFWLYVGGIALPSVIATGVLIYGGAFSGLMNSLLWDASSYSAANRLPYGALAGNHTWDAMLPVLLPPIAVLGWLAVAWLRRKSEFSRSTGLLFLAAIASLAACYPRFGAAQLLFGSAFFWLLCIAVAGQLLSTRVQVFGSVAVFVIVLIVLRVSWPKEDLRPIETPVGVLQVSKRHHVQLNDLLAAVKPGESLFVYPYLPALYFALDVHNPTRYAWLQPGMMGPRDEQSALSDLIAHPPQWIVWHDFTEGFILKNWPSSYRRNLKFPQVEAFFQSNYHAVNPDGVVPVGYRLLEWNQ